MSLRVLLAGLGNRGGMWGRILAEDPETEIAAIHDIDPDRIAAFRAAHGEVPAFARLEDALAADCDAVVLVTPPDGHLAQARAVFAAGLPLLCEKPLALDLAEAREIVAAAEEAGLPLSVGLNFRYLPVTQAIRALVAEERFGRPGFGTFAYMRNRDWWRPGMNTYPRTMAHPMMLEQTIHHLDLIRYAYGREVAALACRTWNPSWSVYAGDANVTCQLTLEDGMEVVYTGTWTGGWNALAFEWRTDCERGVIRQRALFGALETAGTEDEAPTPVPLAPCRPFHDDTAALWRAFREAIAAGAPPPCPGRDHLETLALCFAGLAAHAEARRIDLPAFRRTAGLPPDPPGATGDRVTT